MGTGVVIGAGGVIMFGDPIVRVFASVGIIGAVLLALLLFFREPLQKLAFSQLNSAQTERIFNRIITVIFVIALFAIVAGGAVAVIKSLQPERPTINASGQ